MKHAPPPKVARYVVLRHDNGDGASVFDFMIELKARGMLRAWRLPKWPLDTFYTPALLLTGQRNNLLDYQQPRTGGGAGQLHRVEGGECSIKSLVPWYKFTLPGGRGVSFHKSKFKVTLPPDKQGWLALGM